MSNVQDNQWDRFRRLLPPLQSLELLILRGHLLVEEEFRGFLRAHCKHPEELGAARLSFVQMIQLTRAIGGWPRNDALWHFTLGLNAVRNRLAHRLEPGEISSLVDNLLRAYWRNSYDPPQSNRQRVTALRRTLACVVAMLNGFTEGYVGTRQMLQSDKRGKLSNPALQRGR